MMTADPGLASALERTALQEVIDMALSAHKDQSRTGINAAILHKGRVLVRSENHVNSAPDPTRHAEMVAFTRAAELLGTTDLSDCTLISTLQPCEMCLAAMRFSGIGRVIFAARQHRVAPKYFCFPRLGIDDFAAAGPAFDHVGGLFEDQVLHLYADAAE